MQQWRIQGRGPGGPPPLFFDQNEARGAKKIFWDPALPLSQGLDDRTPPPPLPYLKVWIHHCAVKREDKRSVLFDQQLRTFTHLFSNVFLTYINVSLIGIYLRTFELVYPNLSLPVPINQVIVMEISLRAL